MRLKCKKAVFVCVFRKRCIMPAFIFSGNWGGIY